MVEEDYIAVNDSPNTPLEDQRVTSAERYFGQVPNISDYDPIIREYNGSGGFVQGVRSASILAGPAAIASYFGVSVFESKQRGHHVGKPTVGAVTASVLAGLAGAIIGYYPGKRAALKQHGQYKYMRNTINQLATENYTLRANLQDHVAEHHPQENQQMAAAEPAPQWPVAEHDAQPAQHVAAENAAYEQTVESVAARQV